MSQPTPPPADQPPAKKKHWWLAVFGGSTLWLSIFLHVFFAAVAGYIVVEHFQKKKVDFHATEPPAPHTEVEHKVELAKKNNVDSAPPDLKRITTTDLSPIALPDVPETPHTDDTSPSAMAGEAGMGEGMGGGNGTGGNGGGTPAFGAADGGGLEGYFYDLKQTAGRKPTELTSASHSDALAKFYKILSDFVKGGWDDAVLDKYYKSPKPLYSTRFVISPRPSAQAPKAFKVDVSPSLWAVHYHAKVTAPTGDYRFIGFGDNLMVVRIGGETVLDAGWTRLLSGPPDLRQIIPFVWSKHFSTDGTAGRMKMGKTFQMRAGNPVDMDVLIGDDGGTCGYFLLITEVQGMDDRTPNDTSTFPFFQLDSDDAPQFKAGEEHPPYSTTTAPWTMAQ